MQQASEADIATRIQKDIDSFYSSLGKVALPGGKAGKVAELARMYASDAKSYLSKGDLYTSFSCISYAHGLLDALREEMAD